MNIKKFRDKKSLFIYTERHVNKGAYHAFRHYSEVSQKFRPRDGEKSFKLPFTEIDNREIDLLKTTPDRRLLGFIQGKTNTKFFFHPDMDDFYQKAGCKFLNLKRVRGFIEVVPTASTRTLLVINTKKHFMIKVDLSGKRLGRLVRDLKGSSAKQSNRVNLELDLLAKKKLLPKSMAYLPE